MKNFAVTGVGGHIAGRHLEAIHRTKNRIVAALDPKDGVGVLDRYSFDIRFFTEAERFDRHLEKLKRGPEADRLHFLSVCSPNFLHDAQCRLGLRAGADVICEKPLVINPWNLAPLQELEAETGRRIYNILQLRLHPAFASMRERFAQSRRTHEVDLTYVTARGPWYDVSWKGELSKSGGVGTNIGIHFFDVLAWLFGAVDTARVHLSEPRRMAGFLALERANVRWFLSLDARDMPHDQKNDGKRSFRSMTIDGEELDFSDGFTDLHTRVYEEIIAGRGLGIDAARPAIELAHRLRTAIISPVDDTAHRLVR